MKRMVVLAVAMALPWLSLAACAPAKPALAASDALPDLGMAQLKDSRIERTATKRSLLRISSIVVNVGQGPFEVHGSRTSTSTMTMTVTQRIPDGAGGYTNEPTAATMYFGGDGHNHWHVRDLESFVFERLDDKSDLGTGAKHGFCFFDNYRYGSAQAASYTGCGKSGDLAVTMGLSVGWGDIYPYTLPDQYVDITGLPAGKYRLTAVADESDWFEEAVEDNNTTWVDLQIKKSTVKVLGYGPNA